MAGGSVFDSSFQTVIPQLSIDKQLLAMAMRNKNALNFQPVIDSLKGVGKVFSDAEGNLKKANTAAAKRYLENIPWEDRLALEKKGDPLMTLAQEGIPLDLADAELNKAYSDSRTKARKDKTADWVATKLPMIGYNDWVSYMKGDNPYLFSSYGVDEDMDFVNNPDLRKAVEDSMQNNANRFLMDFDASHNITPSEAIRENMTINQLRYARASDSERSVLAKATKEPADLQTRTNDLVDFQRLVDLSKLTSDQQKPYLENTSQSSNGSVPTQEYKTAVNNADKEKAYDLVDSWVKDSLDLNNADPEYKEAIKNGDLEAYAKTYALKNGMSERDRDAMIESAKSIDVNSRIHMDSNKGLPDLDPQSAIATLRRLERFSPDAAKQMKENTINGLAEDIREDLTDKQLEQLENPNPEVVQNIAVDLSRKYAKAFNINEDSDYFKTFITPAIKQALAGRQEIAQRDANAELAANALTQKQAIEQLVNDPYVQRATGSSASKNTLKEDLLTKESLGRIQGRRNSIKEILPKEAIPIYEACSEDGQRILLHLALIGGFGTNLETFDKYDDDKKLTEIGKLKGNLNLSGLTETAKLVKKAFPKTRQEKESADDTAKQLWDSAANR